MSESFIPQKQQQQLPSTDLHFCTRDQAIRKLTFFLERHRSTTAQHPKWVLVITGSGKHSPNGPVIREAVQKLLDKREMVYRINAKKGSFTVDANSGCVLLKGPQPTDTKVRLASDEEEDVRILLQQRLKMSTTSSSTAVVRNLPPAGLSTSWQGEPRPAEVAADDQQVQQAQQMSLEEQRVRLKNETHEGKLLQRALDDSSEHHEREQEQYLLQKVIAKSLAEQTLEFDPEEERQLEHALSLSQLEERQAQLEEDLEEALHLSLHDVHNADLQQQTIVDEASHEIVDEEIEQLQQALQLSLRQM